METVETKRVNENAIAPSFNTAMVRAEIESQITTAKAYPRDLAVVKNKIMEIANMDQETAASCFYVIPRGGKTIEGPSVRLAEIALACYQNIAAKVEIVREEMGKTYAVARCRDLENNIALEVEVSRRITNKHGHRFSEDMITVTENAAKSIALRNAIFKVIPAILIKPALNRAKLTAVGQAKSLVNRRVEVLDQATKLGVTQERVLNGIGVTSIEHIGIDHLAKLLGIINAVREGDLELDEAFPIIETEKPEDKTKSQADKLKEKITPKPEEVKASESEPAADTGDKTPDQGNKAAEIETPPESIPEDDKQPVDLPKYECQNCNKGFDEPKGNKTKLCPFCLKDDIVEVK